MNFVNSKSSASNFKSFSLSIEQFFSEYKQNTIYLQKMMLSQLHPKIGQIHRILLNEIRLSLLELFWPNQPICFLQPLFLWQQFSFRAELVLLHFHELFCQQYKEPEERKKNEGHIRNGNYNKILKELLSHQFRTFLLLK